VVTETVLVVAAHPDDELLGCGGTLARHVAAKDTVHCLIIGEGATSRPDAPKGLVAELRKHAMQAAGIIGAQPPRFAGLPDNRLDEVPLLQITQRVEEEIATVQPSVIYTHHGGDLNKDHRLLHEAVLTACRPQSGSPVRAIYAYETASSTEWSSAAIDGEGFRPSRFVDISGYLELKLRALACYTSEMRSFPHSRSLDAVRALAVWRGAMSGTAAAEAFVTVRELVR
jgi:N-acetylglucosamine malate deacetylase 1